MLLSANIITFQNNRLSAKQEKKQVATERRKLLSPSVREQRLHRGERQASTRVSHRRAGSGAESRGKTVKMGQELPQLGAPG